MMQPILVKFEGDQSITFTIRELAESNFFKTAPPIPGHDGPAPMQNIQLVFYWIKNPEKFHMIIDAFNDLRKAGKIGFIRACCLLFNKFSGELTKAQREYTFIRQETVTLNDLTTFQRKINDFHRLIDASFTNLDLKVKTNQIVTTLLNIVTGVGVVLQYGLNMIMKCLSQVYQVDGSYFGTVNKIEAIAQFAKHSIHCGIPAKYITNNVYLISDIKIKGKEAKIASPTMGQGRMVMFPENSNFVYKVANNVFGVRGNKTEVAITAALKGTKAEPLIAKILNSWEDNVAISAEKATNIGEGEFMPAHASIINNILAKDGHSFTITDVHYMNVGKIGNRDVIVDYGSAWRR